jgi:hypothetical protein
MIDFIMIFYDSRLSQGNRKSIRHAAAMRGSECGKIARSLNF